MMRSKDVLDVDVRLSDLFRGASRTDESHTRCTETLRKLDQPSLVVDGQ